MKISNVSKKVLASALSAAMVVAFTPVVAFGANNPIDVTGDTVVEGTVASYQGTYTDGGLQKPKTVCFTIGEYGTAAAALNAAISEASGATITLHKDVVGIIDAGDDAVIDLNGHTVSNAEDGTGVDGYLADAIEAGAAAEKTAWDSAKLAATQKKGLLDEAKANTAAKALLLDAALADAGLDLRTSDEDFATAYTAAYNGLEAGDKKTAVNTAKTAYDAAVAAEADAKTAYDAAVAAEADAKTAYDAAVATATVGNKGDFDTVAVSANVTIKNGTIVSYNGTSKTGTTLDNKASGIALNADGATVTLEGVIVEAGDKAIEDGNDNTKAVLKSGTYGAVAADAVEVSGKVETGAITGAVTAKQGADLTVTDKQTKDDVDAAAITGNLTFGSIAEGKTAVVTATATASGEGADATAITGKVFGLKKGATLTASATATGYDSNANGIGGLDGEVKAGTATISAIADDGAAVAIEGAANVNGAAVAATAEGKKADADYSIAVNGRLDASSGTYTGYYTCGTITGGKYTVKPTVDKETYDVIDVDGTYWEVQKAANFDVEFKAGKLFDSTKDADKGDNKVIADFVEDSLEAIQAGKSVEGIKLAEGVKAEDLVKQAQNTKATLKIAYTSAAYIAKKATAEQKAAYEALKAYATENLSLIEDENGDTTVMINTLALQYTDATTGETVVMATITDLGTVTENRETKDNKVTLRAEALGAQSAGSIISYNGASVEKMAWYKNTEGVAQNYVTSRVIPMATAYMTTDYEALKNAVIKGEEQAPTVEKATQSIDVAKKSKTVKLSGAKKTKKAVTFKLGASAETALTISKKSGSSRITVSGQKVTLKKGTKKGTFTAKVSLKAAGSDEFLAAAKTITVKFVVKK